jgi:hypothetical protein
MDHNILRWFVTRRKWARRAYAKRAESGETWTAKRVRSTRKGHS